MDGVKGPRPQVQSPAIASPQVKKASTPAAPATSGGWGPKATGGVSQAKTGATGFEGPTPSGGPVAPARTTASSAVTAPAVGPSRPKNIDEAFDAIVSSSTAPAEVRRHVDNVMAWNMKWDLATKATKSFDFSYFSVERDAYGFAYLGALLKQQMAGVQVTGIVDYMANSRGHGFVSTGLGADYMQELVQYGAKIGVYDTMSTRAKNLGKDGLSYGVISQDHDKLCIADAGTPQAEGETGGRNVAGAYHQDPKDNPKSWRDDSIQIKGKATEGLAEALRREMTGPAVTPMKKDLYNFDEHATELLGAYQLMEHWTKGPALSDAEKAAIRADPAKREALANQLVEQAVADLKTMPNVPDKVRNKTLTSGELKNLKEWAKELSNDLELKGSRAKYDALGGWQQGDVKIVDQVGAASAAPGSRYNEMAPALFTLIEGAQKEIVIQNPYVVLTEDMIKAFERASERGVKVTIVTNSPESTDSAVTQGFFLNDWKKLEERVPTARVFVATGERKFHAKCFVADGKVSGDTSYNADLLSGMVNGEVGAITRSESVAQDLMAHIANDLADPANKFREWTIQRDAEGKVVKGADGQPIATRGPEQDVRPKVLRNYKAVQFLCDVLTNFELGKPLAHPD